MKKVIVLFILLVPSICFCQSNVSLLVGHYQNLCLKRSATNDQKVRRQIELFMEVVKPFVYPDSFPTRFKNFGIENNHASFGFWVDYNYAVIQSIKATIEKNITVEKGSLDICNTQEIANLSSDSGRLIKEKLEIDTSFQNPLMNLILKKNADKMSIAAFKYRQELLEIKEHYQNKYFNGYRNRNILEYFVEGSFFEWRMSRCKKANQGLLQEPSKVAIILLANPIIAVASNSFDGLKTDNANLYTLVPVIGFDWFFNSYKSFVGVSAFHASPILSKDALLSISGSMIGLEAHYNNVVNVGWGMGYSNFDTSDQKKQVQKVFVSVALFNKYFKKKGAERN